MRGAEIEPPSAQGQGLGPIHESRGPETVRIPEVLIAPFDIFRFRSQIPDRFHRPLILFVLHHDMMPKA